MGDTTETVPAVTTEEQPGEKVPEKTIDVDSRLVELEARQRKLDADTRAFEERMAQASATPVSDAFSVDDALDSPFEYFKQHGLDDEGVLELAQSIFFNKFPEKAPPDFTAKQALKASKRVLAKIESKSKEAEEKAKRAVAEESQKEYNRRIAAEFHSQVESTTPETHPYIAAFFAKDAEDGAATEIDKEELMGALISTGANLAKSTGREPKISEVAAELENWLKKRYSRYKPPAAKEESKAPGTDKPGDAAGQPTLSHDNGEAPTTKLTREQRFQRAMEAASKVAFLKKD